MKVHIRLIHGSLQVGDNLSNTSVTSENATTGQRTIDSSQLVSLDKIMVDMHRAGLMCVSAKKNLGKGALDFVFAPSEDESLEAYEAFLTIMAETHFGISVFNNEDQGYSVITFARNPVAMMKMRDENRKPIKNESGEDIWVVKPPKSTLRFSIEGGFTLES